MNEWVKLITKSTQTALEQILIFFPKIFGALILFSLGLGIAKIVEKIFQKIFQLLGVNRISKKSGMDSILKTIGIQHDFDWVLSRLMFWVILFIFLLPVSEILGLAFFADLVNQIINYMPNVMVALVILLAGAWAAKFASGLARGSAARIGSEYAEVTGTIINIMVMLITIVIALFQLKIEIGILSYIILSLFGAFAFGLALAFALGVKDIIKLIVAGAYIHRSLSPGSQIKLRDIEGKIIEIGAVFSVIETADKERISIPNVYFLEAK